MDRLKKFNKGFKELIEEFKDKKQVSEVVTIDDEFLKNCSSILKWTTELEELRKKKTKVKKPRTKNKSNKGENKNGK